MCEQYILGWVPTLVTQILTFCFKRTKSWNFQALKILKWICLAAVWTKLKTGGGGGGGVRDTVIGGWNLFQKNDETLPNLVEKQKHTTKTQD
jgi:hypothetical protein